MFITPLKNYLCMHIYTYGRCINHFIIINSNECVLCEQLVSLFLIKELIGSTLYSFIFLRQIFLIFSLSFGEKCKKYILDYINIFIYEIYEQINGRSCLV